MRFAFAPESKPLDGYTIKRAIHRGGFGEVYYALSDAGKEVALKLLHNNLEVELRGVSQCLNLKHPNLVTIFDMKQDSEKDHWIVMEFVSGKGLYEVMQDYPAGMPLKMVLFWLSGITAGLSFLHDRGIVHRDLKPANIFCEADTVKIGDVGLSKYISESRRSAQTQSVGTVYYMAPEVARGRYGREVDVYSTGVILYEMMTGRVPFEGETTAEILMKHLTAEPDLTVLPEKLRPVLAAALEKDPDRRISEIEELERRFRIAVQESGFSAEKPAPVLPSSAAKKPVATAAIDAPVIVGGAKAAVKKTARPASGESPITSAMRSFGSFWHENVPAPIKWIVYAVAFVIILNRGNIRIGISEFFLLTILYVAYRKWAPKPDDAEAGPLLPRSEKAPLPAAATPVSPMAAAVGNPTVALMPVRPAGPVASVPPGVMRNYSPATLRQIPAGQRAIDTTTSLSVSLAAVVLVTTAVHFATPLLPQIVDIVFFGTVTLIAAAGLIVPAKLWEGNASDNLLRRLIQGTIGIGVGAVAYGVQKFLMLGDMSLLHAEATGFFSGNELGRIRVINDQGSPTMVGFMMFFGLLFAARRWWWQADSFRKSRFRISSTIVSLFVGFVLTALMPFPNNLGAIWALAISAVIQLSAGWTPQEERWLAPAPEPGGAVPVLAQIRHPAVTAPVSQKV